MRHPMSRNDFVTPLLSIAKSDKRPARNPHLRSYRPWMAAWYLYSLTSTDREIVPLLELATVTTGDRESGRGHGL